MKREIKQTSDIRGLEFFNTIKNDFNFDSKKLDYLESISTSKYKTNPRALKLFKEEYNKRNILQIPESEFFSYLVYRYEFKVFPKKKLDLIFLAMY